MSLLHSSRNVLLLILYSTICWIVSTLLILWFCNRCPSLLHSSAWGHYLPLLLLLASYLVKSLMLDWIRLSLQMELHSFLTHLPIGLKIFIILLWSFSVHPSSLIRGFKNYNVIVWRTLLRMLMRFWNWRQTSLVVSVIQVSWGLNQLIYSSFMLLIPWFYLRIVGLLFIVWGVVLSGPFHFAIYCLPPFRLGTVFAWRNWDILEGLGSSERILVPPFIAHLSGSISSWRVILVIHGQHDWNSSGCKFWRTFMVIWILFHRFEIFVTFIPLSVHLSFLSGSCVNTLANLVVLLRQITGQDSWILIEFSIILQVLVGGWIVFVFEVAVSISVSLTLVGRLAVSHGDILWPRLSTIYLASLLLYILWVAVGSIGGLSQRRCLQFILWYLDGRMAALNYFGLSLVLEGKLVVFPFWSSLSKTIPTPWILLKRLEMVGLVKRLDLIVYIGRNRLLYILLHVVCQYFIPTPPVRVNSFLFHLSNSLLLPPPFAFEWLLWLISSPLWRWLRFPLNFLSLRLNDSLILILRLVKIFKHDHSIVICSLLSILALNLFRFWSWWTSRSLCMASFDDVVCNLTLIKQLLHSCAGSVSFLKVDNFFILLNRNFFFFGLLILQTLSLFHVYYFLVLAIYLLLQVLLWALNPNPDQPLTNRWPLVYCEDVKELLDLWVTKQLLDQLAPNLLVYLLRLSLL